jgi:hypothetical protein
VSPARRTRGSAEASADRSLFANVHPLDASTTAQVAPFKSKDNELGRSEMNRSSARNRFGISRAAIALPLIVAGVAASPAAAIAATPHHPVKRSAFKYNVPVNRMALASGSTVLAKGTVTWPQPNVRGWWSANTINRVVRAGVNGGYQSPYSKAGFQCTPTIKGEHTNFVCKMQGADVPTSVNFRYSLVYRGDTASG